MDWKKLWEYLKEPARWVVLAVIAWLIDVIVPQMKPEYIPYLLIVLRGLDKWIHDIGKTVESETLTKSLLRF